MGRTHPKTPSRDERLELIAQSATELFARRGYAATTVEDIVNRAGLTKPMLYRHFESKQELYTFLLWRHREELVGVPMSVYDPSGGDRHRQIVSMIEGWLEHTQSHPDATRLLFTPVRGDEVVEDAQREVHARQRETLADLAHGFAPTGLPPDQLQPVGEIIRTSLAAMALWWIDHPTTPRHALVDALARMVEGLIAIDETSTQPVEVK
jgi:AcrR family transcriptional regulator